MTQDELVNTFQWLCRREKHEDEEPSDTFVRLLEEVRRFKRLVSNKKELARLGSAWSVIPLRDLDLDNVDFLRKYFKDGVNQDNWLLLSTSGIHGNYCSLDEVEPDEDGKKRVSVLIVSPRIVRMHYGHIVYEPKDEPFLRKLVSDSLTYINYSQIGNTEK